MVSALAFLETLIPPDWWPGLAVGAVVAPVVFAAGWALIIRRRSTLPPKVADPSTNGNPGTRGTGPDRRLVPRRIGNPVPVLVSDREALVTPVRGWVVDRSPRGIGLELEEEGAVDVGTILTVRPLDLAPTPWVLIEVRNRQQMGGIWRLGCLFVKPPAWDVLMKFG
jgi:hypothetical protein